MNNPSGTDVPILYDNIAWAGDKKNLYMKGADSESTQWIDPLDERLMVWMRVAAVKNFRKIWGRIDQTLTPGDYELTVVNCKHIF